MGSSLDVLAKQHNGDTNFPVTHDYVACIARR